MPMSSILTRGRSAEFRCCAREPSHGTSMSPGRDPPYGRRSEPWRGFSAPGGIATGFIANLINLLATGSVKLDRSFQGACQGRRGRRLHSTGLVIPADLAEDDWLAAGRDLGQIGSSHQW